MKRSEVLHEAEKCVCGQREQDYGKAEDNFRLIADLWSAYLHDNLMTTEKKPDGVVVESGTYLTTVDVAMMMSLLKIARIKNGGGTGDSFVDLAGYAACGGELHDILHAPSEPKTNNGRCNDCKYELFDCDCEACKLCKAIYNQSGVPAKGYESKESFNDQHISVCEKIENLICEEFNMIKCQHTYEIASKVFDCAVGRDLKTGTDKEEK